MQPEFEIILAALKADFLGIDHDSFASDQTKITFSDSVNVNRLFDLAHHHGCVWEVAAFCKFHQLFDQSEQDVIRGLTIQSTVQAMQNDRQLIQLVEIFDHNDIAYAVLKGAVIFPQFHYGSKQTSRQSADIDILVNARDVKNVVSILSEQGFVADSVADPIPVSEFIEYHENCYKYRDMSFSNENKGLNVDLHWKVAYSFTLPMNTQELLENTEQIELEGRQVKCLSFDEHFILLCIHGYLDKFFILKHLMDIYWAINHPRFDEKNIARKAKRFGVSRQVTAACVTATVFFNADESVTNPSQEYAESVWQRYCQFESKPPRMHPGRNTWSLRDKLLYIKHQIDTRSELVGALSPVFQRLKFDEKMVSLSQDHLPIFIRWPWGFLRRLCSRN